MDVLTAPAKRVEIAQSTKWRQMVGAVVAYTLLVCVVTPSHEPWADEAQSWLLARDASLLELWGRLLHYEGTTGLWQTLLHGLILAGLPYSGMNYFSSLLGVAGAAIAIWRAPFPLGVRFALPFTYFLCYQYSVVARSYDLLPLLLFVCAALYPKRERYVWAFTGVLALMAAVSVHGMALAIAIGVTAVAGVYRKDAAVGPAIGLGAVVVLLALAARPASDGTFVTKLNWNAGHFVEVCGRGFSGAFTAEWISSLAVVALSLPVLWKGGALGFFSLATVLLCGIDAVVYSQVWHSGILFLAWLFAMWIAVERSRPPTYSTGLMCLLIAVQCYWTVRAIQFDEGQAYSGSRTAAAALKGLAGKKIFAIGYACVAIEPYFEHNVFANVNDGRPEGYWDWSRRNHVNEDSLHLADTRPDYVMVGYKNDFERSIWTDAVRKSGYRQTRHFEGNTYWQTSVLEPESYDLFARDDVR